MSMHSSDWIATVAPNPEAKLRLFCFPYAGGGDHIYRGWREWVPSMIEVCPVQLPGRGRRINETPFTEISLLVRAASAALAPYLDKPFALFGHSMGALICFELTRQLRRDAGPQPSHLFLSACSNPNGAASGPHPLSNETLITALGQVGGIAKQIIDDELLDLMLPSLEADLAACQTYLYLPEPPLDCPMTVFGGLQDKAISRNDLEGWREHTAGPFSVKILPGDHYFVHTAQSLLLRSITSELCPYISCKK